MIAKLINRIKLKLIKLRLQPIRVFCLHHVCKTYEESTMYYDDWMQIDEFKAKVLSMQQNRVEFISLTDAYAKLTNDKFRNHKYAVLTFDDGYASLNEILPWMEGQNIPATLFINGKYLDGKSYRDNPNEKYLTKKELFSLTSPLIEIGSHGWEHNRLTDMKMEEFEKSVEQNVRLLSEHPSYVPFWAYTYGTHTKISDEYLRGQKILPIYIEGSRNYNNKNYIDREFLN